MKPTLQIFKSAVFSVLIVLAGMSAPPGKAVAQSFLGDIFGGGGPTGRHVVSLKVQQRPGTILVSIGDRRLYKILPGNRAISYPIAIPNNEAFWSGTLPVTRKAVNPSWTPTAQMRRENPKLPPFVPGGHPRNPMGVRALYLGSTLYRIHGTDAPWLIGRSVSRGCIRMYNEDVIDLYNRTNVGTKVVVTGKSFLGAASYVQSNSAQQDVFSTN
ncbi:MAG: L,D-transpeptidase [Hyphomicrobiaceae bacterium]|nr:L,D-transpeptidase [Hyphomicrobiaceae bacterium]